MFVNGEYVDDELIRLEAARLKDELREEIYPSDELAVEIRARELARERVLERVLLQQAAREDPEPIATEVIEKTVEQYCADDSRHAQCMLPPDREALRASIELEFRIERLIAQITANVRRPDAHEIGAYYRQAKQSFHVPEQVHAAHIVKDVNETTAESEALRALTEAMRLLKNGAKFEDLADEYSDCPGRGGDLGLFARGEMVEEFEEVVFQLAPGETSEIFRSPFGFHIAKLHERKPARVLALKEVRDEIEKILWEQRAQLCVRSFLGELRGRAEIRKSNPATARETI